MTLSESVKHVFLNYLVFSGRADRSEFWWWVLASMIIGSTLMVIDIKLLHTGGFQFSSGPGEIHIHASSGILGGIWSLITALPSLALCVRRLHDIDRSGWWLLIGIVPILGWLVVLYWYVKRGTNAANRFGSGPAAA